jgi:branched-chain amino acid transport system ATP-binding protein
MHFVELANVSLSYGAVRVLSDISLSIDAGTSLAVLGANGSGKTTLLRGISGVIVTRHGSIQLEGREISHLGAHEIVRHGISHVPEGKHLFKPLTVRENIEIGALPLHRLGRSAEADGCRDLIYDLFPILKARGGQIASTLSGGEQQMLAIARALMSRPKMLLLDEPSVGLAPKINEILFAALKSLKALGIVVVVAEQVVRLACDLADKAVVMHLGRVAMTGASADVRDSAELKRLYLGGKKDPLPGLRKG